MVGLADFRFQTRRFTETQLPLVGRGFFRLILRSFGLDRGDLAGLRVNLDFRNVLRAGLRDVERPDQDSVFPFEFRALDYAARNSCQCDFFCLTLRHVCFLHQLSFTRLCLSCTQYAQGKRKANCQDSAYCHLHECFDPGWV
jgi:hypothetical protein